MASYLGPFKRMGYLLGLLGVTVLAGCGKDLPQSVFDPHGPVARMQLRLLSLTMWLALLVGTVVAALSIYVAWRFREKPGDKGLPPQIHGNHKLEVLWTIIPIAILTIIAVPTVQTAQAVYNPPQGALKVRVIGRQWFWDFEYPELGIKTSNELHIPVGRPIELEVTSQDVIHSFWVPKLMGTIDVIPNRVNKAWMQADEPGEYSGQCKEFCGASHAKMKFRVIAEDPAKFEEWVKKMKQYSVTVDSDLAKRGQQLFFEKSCYQCHAISGLVGKTADGKEVEAKGTVGPNLTGVGSRRYIAAGYMPNTDENLKLWLKDPGAVKPGAKMPNLQLKEDELQALVAFLRSVK